MKSRTTIALFLSFLLLAVTACSEQDKGKRAVAKFELFELVPADTPYVVASSRPLPRVLSERMLKAVSMQREKWEAQLVMMEAEAESTAQKRLSKMLLAVSQELEGNLSREGLSSLGFAAHGRSVVYGLGVMPVAWFEIEDPDKVSAFLDRVEMRAGLTSRRGRLGQIDYRRYEMGKISGIAALKGGYLVFALMPREGEAELLPLALGEEKPEHSLAESGAFREFTARHGFLGYNEGYVDWNRILEMVLGEAGGINARVLQILGVELEEVSPGCRRLAKFVVQGVPRLGFGYVAATDDSYTVEVVVESSPGVGGWLKQVAAPVPGLGSAAGATFSFGVGLDLPKVRDGLKVLLGNIAEQGKECETLDQQELVQATQSLDLMLNPMLAGVKGFNLVLDEIQVDPDTLEPKSVAARLLVAATDPRGLFGMAGMLDPKLAMLQIPQDGTPVKLPLEESLPMAPPAWVAIQGEALGLFLEAQPPNDAARVLSEPPASSSLILALDYDVKKLLQQIGPSLEHTMETMQGEEAEDAREVYETIKETASLYDHFSFGIHGEERGLVMRGKVEFGSGSAK